MKKHARHWLTGLVAAGVVASLGGPGYASTSSSASAPPRTAMPAGGARFAAGSQPPGRLVGVSTVSAVDTWAVGTRYQGSLTKTLAEHWDGSAWSTVPTPNPRRGTYEGSQLTSVSAGSADDVWAVGDFYAAKSRSRRTVAEHWDGSRWSIVTTPSPAGRHGYDALLDVTTISDHDAWAVGFTEPARGQEGLAMHWDGSSWSVTALPTPPKTPTFSLTSVAATGPDDVWAVGYGSFAGSRRERAVVEHWNGSTWSLMTDADLPPGTRKEDLWEVDAIADNDMWAVGSLLGATGSVQTFTEHWDGSAWTLVASPNLPGDRDNVLYGVSRCRPRTSGQSGRRTPGERPLRSSSTGTVTTGRWSAVKPKELRLSDVSMISSTSGVSVGYSGQPVSPLIERWDGTSWE